MKKIIASAAVLLGISGSLLVSGVSPAMANPTWTCKNDTVVGVVDCSTVLVGNTVTVAIKDAGNPDTDLRALNNSEISVLETNLNNVANPTIDNIKAAIVTTYVDFSPSIDIQVGEITVCGILSYCA